MKANSITHKLFSSIPILILLGLISITIILIISKPTLDRSPKNISKTSVTNGEHQEQLMIDNNVRNYELVIPDSYPVSRSLPLLIALHGENDTAASFIKATRLLDYSNKQSFILAAPNSQSNWQDTTSDLNFISQLIDHLESNYKVNPAQISIVGFSAGGIMGYEVGCQLTSKISSLAVVAANFKVSDYANCQPNSSLPISIINGSNDLVMPYNGGEINSMKLYGNITKTDESVNLWFNNNNCSGDPNETMMAEDPTNNSHIEREDYSGCTPVISYQVINGGHSWPGAHVVGEKGIINMSLNTTEILLNFFKNNYN